MLWHAKATFRDEEMQSEEEFAIEFSKLFLGEDWRAYVVGNKAVKLGVGARVCCYDLWV